MRRASTWTLAIACLAASTGLAEAAKYQPNWESLDQRPVPKWFNEAKFGIFVVWGPYSVPAWAPKGRYAEWYGNHMRRKGSPTAKFHAKVYGADFKYEQFAPKLTAEMWDPDQWADLFAQSGARYVVCTANYHDGYCLFPNPYRKNWNSMDVGPKRDLLGELGRSVRAKGMKMGIYYSLGDAGKKAIATRRKEGRLTVQLPERIQSMGHVLLRDGLRWQRIRRVRGRAEADRPIEGDRRVEPVHAPEAGHDQARQARQVHTPRAAEGQADVEGDRSAVRRAQTGELSRPAGRQD